LGLVGIRQPFKFRGLALQYISALQRSSCGASTGYSRSDRVCWWAARRRCCHAVDASCIGVSSGAARQHAGV